MMRRINTAGVGLLALALPAAASASCWPFLDFGQLTEGCAGGSAYCYVISPGVNTPDSIESSFWSLTTGDPAIGVGDDHGAWEDEEGWLVPEGPGAYLAGTWSASAAIDGCIDGRLPPGHTSEVMVVALADTDAAGSVGYFAVAAAGRHPDRYPQFDYAGGIARDLTLAAIPRPAISSVVRVGPNEWLLRVRPPALPELEAGFYSDGAASLDETFLGFRLYRRDRRVNEPVPSDRHRAAWTPATAVVPLDSAAEITVQCLGQTETYLATAIVFDRGFETGYVSSNSAAIRVCGWCFEDNDQDGFFVDPECPPFDCDDTDPATHPYAPETNDGKDNQCGDDPGFGVIDEISGTIAAASKVDLSWPAQTGATSYEVTRDESPVFDGPCVTGSTASTSWSDLEVPAPAHAFHYLVRALAPHAGSWGQDSSGAERVGVCP